MNTQGVQEIGMTIQGEFADPGRIRIISTKHEKYQWDTDSPRMKFRLQDISDFGPLYWWKFIDERPEDIF